MKLAPDPRLLLPLAACVGFAALGWLLTSIPAPQRGTAAGAEWSVPPLTAWRKEVTIRDGWEALPPGPTAAGGPAAPTQPLTRPDWRIVAVAITGKERTAILRQGDNTQELRVGDQLPGGAAIRGIEADRLIIELSGKRRALRMSPQ